jgi:hypothetical protein
MSNLDYASAAGWVLMYSHGNARRNAVLMTALLLFSGTAFGQTAEEEPSAVLELAARLNKA